jgi:hypothetical protein
MTPRLHGSIFVEVDFSALEVTTSKDVPGFVSNALLMPFLNEVFLSFLDYVPTTESTNAGDNVLRKG